MAHYFVTGVSSGIGRALVTELCRKQNDVSGVARRAERLEDLKTKNRSFYGMVCDVTEASSLAYCVSSAEEMLGNIDVAILNAGIYVPQDGKNIDPSVYAKHMDINYMGVINALAPIIPSMIKRGTGHIAIMASAAGWRGLPKAAAYGPTKAALISLSESLYFDLKKTGVRLQVICPGFVDTEATSINNFYMPGLMTADAAAQEIVAALKTDIFMPHFPKSFTANLALLSKMPHKLFFKIIGKTTGH